MCAPLVGMMFSLRSMAKDAKQEEAERALYNKTKAERQKQGLIKHVNTQQTAPRKVYNEDELDYVEAERPYKAIPSPMSPRIDNPFAVNAAITGFNLFKG